MGFNGRACVVIDAELPQAVLDSAELVFLFENTCFRLNSGETKGENHDLCCWC